MLFEHLFLWGRKGVSVTQLVQAADGMVLGDIAGLERACIAWVRTLIKVLRYLLFDECFPLR